MSVPVRARVSQRSSARPGLAVAGFSAAVVLIVSVLASACVGDITDSGTDNPVDPTAGGTKARFVRATNPVPNEYIVVMKDQPGFAARETTSLAATLASSYNATVKLNYTATIKGFAASMTEEDALALAQDPMVAYVAENGRVQMSATQTGATWGIDRLDQRNLPLDGNYTYNVNASNVTAYIVDTGIRVSHSQFGGRASSGTDTIDNDNNADDCNGHGTHVAGTIGGSTYGVAKNVKLVAVRVLDCAGSGTDASVIAGIDWVTANHSGPSVANMSLGGGASQPLDDAVTGAINAGVVFAVAAGNESQDACNTSPARTPAAITVGATTSSDARASYSNYGSCVDIFAPGSSITSSWNTSNTATNTISGTSMATPHVVGAAALYLSANPNATPSQVRDALVNNATSGKVTNPGSGSPNKLLYTGFIGGGTEPPPPTGTPRTGSDSGSLARNAWKHEPAIQVLAGTTLTATITGTGDADLYVRWGAQPTTASWTCRPYTSSSSETCSLTVPAGTTSAYISVRGYTAATFNLNYSWTQP